MQFPDRINKRIPHGPCIFSTMLLNKTEYLLSDMFSGYANSLIGTNSRQCLVLSELRDRNPIFWCSLTVQYLQTASGRHGWKSFLSLFKFCLIQELLPEIFFPYTWDNKKLSALNQRINKFIHSAWHCNRLRLGIISSQTQVERKSNLDILNVWFKWVNKFITVQN